MKAQTELQEEDTEETVSEAKPVSESQGERAAQTSGRQDGTPSAPFSKEPETEHRQAGSSPAKAAQAFSHCSNRRTKGDEGMTGHSHKDRLHEDANQSSTSTEVGPQRKLHAGAPHPAAARGDAKTATPQTGEAEMVDTETVDTETVDTKTVDTKTVDTKTVKPKAVEPKAVEAMVEAAPPPLEENALTTNTRPVAVLDEPFARSVLRDLAGTIPDVKSPNFDRDLEDLVTEYQFMRRKDVEDSLLCRLELGLTNATMISLSRATDAETLRHQEAYLRLGTKGALAVAEIIKLRDARHGGQPLSLNVGQVNVQSGGQAIVGTVEHPKSEKGAALPSSNGGSEHAEDDKQVRDLESKKGPTFRSNREDAEDDERGQQEKAA